MAEQKRDYYEVLGVSKDADDAAAKTEVLQKDVLSIINE